MNITKKQGFTLLEILIYTAMVGVIMLGVIMLAVITLEVRGKVRASIILEQNYRLAMNRMTSYVNGAEDILYPAPGETASELTLENTEAATNPTVFNLQNGILFVQTGSDLPMQLTSEEVEIEELLFIRASTTSPMVRMVMSGKYRDASSDYPSQTVTTTAVIRK